MSWSISTTRIQSRSIDLFVRREVIWSYDHRRIHVMVFRYASITRRLSLETLLSHRSPFVSFCFLDIVMKLRSKERYSFKDAVKGKRPTKRQSQVKEDIPFRIYSIHVTN